MEAFATDMDNDGDMDILSVSSGDNKLNWYENTTGVVNLPPTVNNEIKGH